MGLTIANELNLLLHKSNLGMITQKFQRRLEEGGLTQEENSQSHFCVCIFLVDIEAKKIFLNHHKKSNFWLCFGGHVKTEETLKISAQREINEEAGARSHLLTLTEPEYITTTLIENVKKDGCRLHFDVWYLVRTSEKIFKYDPLGINPEFYDQRWFTLDQARQLPTSKSMLQAIDFVEHNIFIQRKMKKIFLSFRFTGEDFNELQQTVGKLILALEDSGHQVYCTLSDEPKFKAEKWDASRLMHYVFQKIDESDLILAFIRTVDKSEGMGVEVGYALAKGIPLVTVHKKGVTTSCIAQLSNQVIEYDLLEDLIEKIRQIG